MEAIKRYLSGDLEKAEIRRYLMVMSCVFWGFIFLAWLGYPAEHKYSITTHTFSFLGSYNEEHNPQWWWLFSIAMLFWCFAGMALAQYYRRRFSEISVWAAWVGAILFMLGCLNIGLVAVFPDVRTVLSNGMRVTEIHEKVAVFAAASFILCIIWHGVLLLKDWLGEVLFGNDRQLAHSGMWPPYVFWLTVLIVGSYHLIKWEHIYAAKKAAAKAAGLHIGSSWSEAMGTRYAFPLWENVLIYTLFIFLIWFAAALSKEE